MYAFPPFSFRSEGSCSADETSLVSSGFTSDWTAHLDLRAPYLTHSNPMIILRFLKWNLDWVGLGHFRMCVVWHAHSFTLWIRSPSLSSNFYTLPRIQQFILLPFYGQSLSSLGMQSHPSQGKSQKATGHKFAFVFLSNIERLGDFFFFLDKLVQCWFFLGVKRIWIEGEWRTRRTSRITRVASH